jgi:hypothetical protein
MFVIEVSRKGEVRLEEWADQDYSQELNEPRSRTSVPEADALDLWKHLARGEIEVIRILIECGPGRLMA